MSSLKTLILLSTFIFVDASAQKDTISLDARALDRSQLKLGKSDYIMFARSSTDSLVKDLTLVKMEVSKTKFKDISGLKVSQSWHQKDTVIHTSTSILDPGSLKTVCHKTWWKRNNQVMEIDFDSKKHNIQGGDPTKHKVMSEGIEKSFLDRDFINWHCDIQLFGLLPFKLNTVFKLKVYDPGYSVPAHEIYEVTGEEKIDGVSCWVLNYKLPRGMGYQRFWIAKKDRVLVKEEDSFNGMYRFKLRAMTAH